MCNSTPQVAAASMPLEHQAMKITALKDLRRERLTMLIDEVGQIALSARSGIAEAYLYQMSKGTGSARRGVSDKNARKIEIAAGKPPGWLDDSLALTATGAHAGTSGAAPEAMSPEIARLIRAAERAPVPAVVNCAELLESMRPDSIRQSRLARARAQDQALDTIKAAVTPLLKRAGVGPRRLDYVSDEVARLLYNITTGTALAPELPPNSGEPTRDGGRNHAAVRQQPDEADDGLDR